MKRRFQILIILALSIFSGQQVCSQCLINTGLVYNTQNLTLEELFYIDISCTTDGKYQVCVDVIQNNSLIIRSLSAWFDIPGNSVYFNAFNIGLLKPFNISNVNGSSVSSAIIAGGYFPEGDFIIKYTLYQQTGEKLTEVFSSTEQIMIPLLMSPQIMLPECNSKTKVEESPIFIWTPAVSSEIYSSISYNFKLVMQQDKQNPNVAYYSNAPLIFRPYLQDSYYIIENDEVSFSPGKCYAWAIEAVRDGTVIGMSDICNFCIADTAKKIISGNYVDVRNSDMNKSILLKDHYVHIMYYESYMVEPDKTLNVRMYNDKGKEIKLWQQDYPIQKGKNFIDVDICTDRDIKPGQYKLVITNDKNEIFVCKFFKPKDVKCTTINNYK